MGRRSQCGANASGQEHGERLVAADICEHVAIDRPLEMRMKVGLRFLDGQNRMVTLILLKHALQFECLER
jgi:hypothetical protein